MGVRPWRRLLAPCFVRALLVAAVAGAPACGGGSHAGDGGDANDAAVDGVARDAGIDAVVVDAHPALCRDDGECSDELFCTGTERCLPDHPEADARGCVAGEEPCAAPLVCDETARACVRDCSSPDGDGDGHASLDCGGDDCDDADGARHPGAEEVCDAVAHDEDCDASSFGSRDEDGDGAVDAGCCNMDAGGLVCGTDCDDTDPAVYPGAPLAAPRPLWPPNGARTGSWHAPATAGTLRPAFRWLATGDCASPPSYELEVDDSCATPGFASCTFPSPEIGARGLTETSYVPGADLPISTSRPVGRRYYWRVRACRGAECSEWSPVRYLDVGRARGDLDGDGYSDLVVGEYLHDGAGADAVDEGAAYVYYGSAAGIAATPSVGLSNPGLAARGVGFGVSIASAGDLDADGFSDLVVGTFIDGAFVYYGSASGVAATPSVVLRNPAGQPRSSFGFSISSAGDLNADGFADLVAGALWESAGADREGNAFVYYGSATGVAATPDVALDNPDNQANAGFGDAVSCADLDGDGYSDLAVGASFQDAPEENEGNVFLYYGSAIGVAPEPSLRLDNPADQPWGTFGRSLAAGSDLNGDGYAELVVGAEYQDAPERNEGNVFVYHGGPAGVRDVPSITLDNPSDQAGARFGAALACSGDVSGDGLADLVVGIPFDDVPGMTDVGGVSFYPGAPGGIGDRPMGGLRDGGAGGLFGVSIASGGDLNGDGRADVVVGAPGNRIRSGIPAGSVFVHYGTASGTPRAASLALESPAPQWEGAFGVTVGAGD